MPIRTRLLASFIAIAILVLAIFGIVAYRIAQESAALQEAMTLQRGLEEVAGYLAPGLQRTPYDLDQLRQLRFPYLQHARLFLVHDAENRIIDIGEWQRDNFPGKARLFADLAGSSYARSGQINGGSERYTWASVFIPGTNLRLTVVHPAIITEFATLRTLGMRLLVTAGVVIWIAVWGALIITSLLTRHLRNQQQANETGHW